MATHTRPRIYDEDGDRIMAEYQPDDRIVVVPDTTEAKQTSEEQKIRVMWGQLLLDDLLAGRYRTLVCAVNAEDNATGIVTDLANKLPTSQWTEASITQHAKRFSTDDDTVKVLKYDMDAVEVLALLRPANRDHLTLDDLWQGFRIATEMISRRTSRQPSASVSFLGARSNRLVGPGDEEPSFETVLRIMHDAGYHGDVYPAPQLWDAAPTAVYARYPFPDSVARMREGGF